MIALVTYDMNTTTKQGRRRLRRVAKACEDFGQRVQFSVFECLVSEADLVRLRKKVLDEIDESEDSVRIYRFSEADHGKVEHWGTKEPRDMEEPFIV